MQNQVGNSYMFFGIVVSFALLILPLACTSQPVSQKPREVPAQPEEARKAPRPLEPGDIIDTKTGNRISFEALMERLSTARIIYVGETHTNIDDHRAQLEIMKALYAQNPSLALAMEMFPRKAQPVLDRYSAGTLSEAELLKDAKWEKVWGFPFELYRPILSWARDNGLKIIGLNAPIEIVRKVARTGLASLSRSERAQIASDFHLNDTEHRNYVRKEYEQHLKGSIKGFETFYEAQLTWEETMAETLARALRSLPENERIVVIIGNGHIVDQVGAPRLTRLRVEDEYKTVVTIPVDQASMEEIKPEIGDFVWITQKGEAAHHGRLGIMLHPGAGGKGLKVLDVVPDGPAARAGVRKGDLLYKIDGIRIRSIDDIHRAVSVEKPSHELTLKRDGREINVTITTSK